MLPAPRGFESLRDQLLAAAEAFAGDGEAGAGLGFAELLASFVGDVARAVDEPLEIFPVCHHSPAAAVHMVQRLRRGPAPRVVFLELCEDLLPLAEKLRDCRLPIALQAFAGRAGAFPATWAPLSLVAPLSEFSAEYQAIAYCLENPATALVFVDRSVDHVFQWLPQEEDGLRRRTPSPEDAPEEPEPEEGGGAATPSHGAALGVQVGRMRPSLPLFHDLLLRNARVQHFAEWWDRYVELPLAGADLATYRQVLALVGSLFRRLGERQEQVEVDRLRERYMWTRMKQYLRTHGIAPAEALHVCGAFHAVSDVPEFGTGSDATWEIPPATDTRWQYGLLPSSHRAIDWQFGLPAGTVTLAEAQWEKSQRSLGLAPFVVTRPGRKPKKAPAPKPLPAPSPDAPTDLLEYLTRARLLVDEDHEQLLGWCVGIVALARRNGYLGSTADAIAVYQTSVLLAQLRNRTSPTAYDFRDAAITCLEKDRTPKKRDIPRLCDMLLGGDRIGQVGRDSLPALARDVYDRLAPLGLDLETSSTQRALLDLRREPKLRPASDLLWKLWYLLGPATVKPIMGEKALGVVPVQESWEVYVGRNQAPLITLGYEGVTLEQVLEKRLREKAFGAEAETVSALAAAEECLLYLDSVRLGDEIGRHAVLLLSRETGAQAAPEIFTRARRLIHHFRSTGSALPAWLQEFVRTGYAHFTTLLPTAFQDRGTAPAQVASLLAFVFTLESLALSLGCRRSQLTIAVQQAGPGTDDPRKLGLLWTAEWLLGLRTLETVRAFFDRLLANRAALDAMPAYLDGYLLALQFTPLVAPLVVELTSKAFARLPEPLLMPWLPGLITMLRAHGETVLPTLMKEVARCYPETAATLAGWRSPWDESSAVNETAAAVPSVGGTEAAVQALVREHPATTDALAHLLGAPVTWASAATTAAPADGVVAATRDLVHAHPETARALAACVPGASLRDA